MSRVIHKYTLEKDFGVQELDVPKGASFFEAALQMRQPRLWALVDKDQPTEKRRFLIRGKKATVLEGKSGRRPLFSVSGPLNKFRPN